ncbi:hypothetical protein [Heyndrickxia ginsengihumi]|uniref:hypothetical protein n=1 Tax=Heyndrickxia ginsengihumi TaxID=363870 RepID=UPI0004721681|nr:hypothetical protein [Heyndrickxia ginsengihumi]
MDIAKLALMWRKELERQNISMGAMSVFDSMLSYIGEQQREINNLKADMNIMIEKKFDKIKG